MKRRANVSANAGRIPVVGIGMPVYNASRWIREAIESVLSQTYQDFELVIVDNRSTDDTYDICLEYQQSDPRISLSRNDKNIGAAHNFNRVFERSQGKYFKWASGNDLCASTYLEKCVEVLDGRPDVVLCYPRTLLIDEEGRTIEEYEDRLHLLNDDPYLRFRTYLENARLNNVEQGLMRRSALEQTGLQGNFQNTDTVLLAEISLHGKFFELPEFLFSRRMAKHASTKFKTNKELAYFFNPEANGLSGQAWRQLAAYFGAIRRAPVAIRDKMRLWGLWARMVRWSRSGLLSDLRQVFRFTQAT